MNDSSPHVEDPAEPDEAHLGVPGEPEPLPAGESPHEDAPDAAPSVTVDHDPPAETIVDPLDDEQSDGPRTTLTTDPDVIAEDEADSYIEPLPSPHGEAAELADPWVFDRWIEHHEIDERLNAIPLEDRNPAAARQAHPQAGVTP